MWIMLETIVLEHAIPNLAQNALMVIAVVWQSLFWSDGRRTGFVQISLFETLAVGDESQAIAC
ncbi:MAG: hypothetical protein ACI9EW_002738 [Cellvibrionaceae bacterium]|jgi:hypothetical protein